MKASSSQRLRVNVDRIPDEGLSVGALAPFDEFPELKAASFEEDVQFLSPVRIALRVRRVSDFIEATGSLGITLGLSCSRCLGTYTQVLDLPFSATYTGGPHTDTFPSDGEGVEITAESVDLFRFRGKEIDLSEAIQEQILLALPLRPLCREECKGLCPRCGADLNKGPCGCGQKPVDPRLAVLGTLKIKKD